MLGVTSFKIALQTLLVCAARAGQDGLRNKCFVCVLLLYLSADKAHSDQKKTLRATLWEKKTY